MRKGSFIFFMPLVLGVILSLAGFVWWRSAISAPSASDEEVRVVIEKGMSVESIGEELQKAGVVKSALAFKIYTQMNKDSIIIPPGEFMMPQNLRLTQAIEYLQKGPREYWVTIPEGLRREQIPQRFISAFGLTAEEAKVFRSEFLSSSKNLEGYLFPDSYLFPPDISAEAIVDRLTKTFYEKIGEDYEKRASQLELDLHQAVTMASLIERETITDEERPVVAGIIFNRLRDGMKLDIDATVQYALGTKRCRVDDDGQCNWWKPPTRADLEVVSDYNTYINAGLPPGPIANPGLSSLEAVVSPVDTDYYYYIHADGQIYYAKTLDEHLANVNKYLR